MKDLLSRITSFALGTACFVMTTPIFTVAAEVATVDCEIENPEEVVETIDMNNVSHEITDYNSITIPSYGSNFGADAYNYGYSLDTNNMAVYNTLVCMMDPKTEPIKINLPEEVKINLGQRGSAEAPITEEEKAKIYAALAPSFLPGYGYLLLDYPEICWQDTNFSYAYNINFECNEITNEYTLKIKDVQLQFQLHPYFNGDIELAKQYKNDLNNAVGSFQVEGTTRLDKLKSIHDQLASSITYDINADMPFTAYGAMLKSASVCEGYAESFKLLCDRENIPCILVVSSNHMWNHVQMDDGQWYSVDVTWDDYDRAYDDREYVYDNFLKGMITSFRNGHIPASSLYGLPFNYPALSKTDYVLPDYFVPGTAPQTVETTTETTTTTVTEEVITETTTTSEETTTETTTTTTTAATESEVPAVTTAAIQYKCDTNNDGQISVSDVVVCQITILTYGSNANCDINNDGISNIFDLIMMKRMLRRGEFEVVEGEAER